MPIDLPPPQPPKHVEVYKPPAQGIDGRGNLFFDPRENPFSRESKFRSSGDKEGSGKAPANVPTTFSAGSAVLGSSVALPKRNDVFVERSPGWISSSRPMSSRTMPVSSPSMLMGSISIPGLKLEVDKIAREIRACREALLFAIDDSAYVKDIENVGSSREVIVNESRGSSGIWSPRPVVEDIRKPGSDFDKRYVVYSQGVDNVRRAVDVICDGERLDFDSLFEAYSAIRVKMGNALSGVLKFLEIGFSPTFDHNRDRAGFLNLIVGEIGKKQRTLDEMARWSPIIRKYIDGAGIGLSGVRAQVREAVLGAVCLPGEIGKLNKAFEDHSFKGKEYARREELAEGLSERLTACRGLIDSGLGFDESLGRNLTERQKRAFGKLADNKLFKKVNWILRELRGERKTNKNYLRDLFMLARDIGVVSEDDWYESKDPYRTLRRALLEKKDQLLRRKFKRERKDSEVLKSREQKWKKSEDENDFDNSSVIYRDDGKTERVSEFSEEFKELPDEEFTRSYWDDGDESYGLYEPPDRRSGRDFSKFSSDWDWDDLIDKFERGVETDDDQEEFYDAGSSDKQGSPRRVAKREMFEKEWSASRDKYGCPTSLELFRGDIGLRRLYQSKKKGEGQNYRFVDGKKVYYNGDGKVVKMHSRQKPNPPRRIDPKSFSSKLAGGYKYSQGIFVRRFLGISE